MEKVFNNNVWSLIGLVLLLVFLVIIFTVIYFILCLLKAFDPVSLAKTAIIVKLLQIPSYVVIFILGLLFLIAIFTVPFYYSVIYVLLRNFIFVRAFICCCNHECKPQRNDYRDSGYRFRYSAVYICCRRNIHDHSLPETV